jgi:glutamate-cysteine ligase
VLAAWPEESRDHVSSETHSSAVELRTGAHATADDAVAQLSELRVQLGRVLAGLGLAAGASGTHPSAVWHEMAVSSRGRHQHVHGSMRELARREPTFALHVDVGLPTGEAASPRSTACARTFRSCSPCRRTRRSGRAATRASRRRARRSSRRSRASARDGLEGRVAGLAIDFGGRVDPIEGGVV